MAYNELSSLTSYDSALINAHFLNLTDDNFQCARIEKLYSKRKDKDKVIAHRRKSKGCQVITDKVVVELNNLNYHSCLCHDNFKHPNMHDFLMVYDQYKKGTLPFSGGYLEQPAQIIEVISLIDCLMVEKEKQDMDKIKSK